MAVFLHNLADFKTLLEFKDSTQDAKLILLQDRVYQRIEAYLGRFLEKMERTETIRVNDTAIPLKALPVDTGQTINVTRIADLSNGGTTTVITNTEYDVTDYGLKLGSELKKNEKLTVTYTGGFVKDGNNVLTFLDTDNSKSIIEAATIQLTHEWNKRFKPGADTQTTDLGTINSRPLELLKDVKAILNAVRHPRMWWFQ